MARHQRTVALIEAAAEILAAHHPMTLRQLFYRLVAAQLLDNTRSRYQALGEAVRDARREGAISWEWIEDRLRRPRHVSMWDGLADFAAIAASAYRRDVWSTQPRRIEAWLEKDALSGIFEDVLGDYGVTLNVGRGYDGWSSVHQAAQRLDDGDTILYFGDFDPSGEDMVRSLRERLADRGAEPEIIKCALVFDDIERYQLPPDFTKTSDSRRAGFIARWGDVTVELDALPVEVLRERLVDAVESRIDLDALDEVHQQEAEDREQLVAALSALE
jgi:hypothetical protein